MVYYGLTPLSPAYDFYAATSNVPFLALLNGSQGPPGEAFAALARETKGVNAGLAAVVAAGIALQQSGPSL